MMQKKTSDKNREFRAVGEVRNIDEDGTFEGYIVVWDVVDDYNTRFSRGAFKKTIQERASKLKVLYNHKELIGSNIEVREDDHGVFVRGKLNLDVQKAKETYSFLKDGTLEGLSFGFRTIKKAFVTGVTEIREVILYEYGPVIFPAGQESVVTHVRAENFDESLSDANLDEESWLLRRALNDTLSDIWWSETSNSDNVLGKLDEALADYHAAYLDFASRWVQRYWGTDEERSLPFQNELSTAVNNYLVTEKRTLKEAALNTSLTVDDLNELRQGNLIENRDNLHQLGDKVVTEHRNIRNKAVETLCLELRDTLTNSEKRRISALLTPANEQSEPSEYSEDMRNLTDYFRTIGEKDE